MEEPQIVYKIEVSEKDILLAAASKGDTETLKFILTRNLLLDEIYDKDGFTALHLATQRGHRQAVELILQAGASPNVGTKYFGQSSYRFCSPISEAIKNGNVELVKILIAYKAQVKQLGPGTTTPLVFSVAYCDNFSAAAEILELLLAAGADVHAKGSCDITILWEAVSNNRSELFDLLIKKGCFPKGLAYYGKNLLFAAAQSGNIELFEKIRAFGLDIFSKSEKDETLLHSASARPAMTKHLLDLGLDVNAKTKDHYRDTAIETPLHLAMRNNTRFDNKEVIGILLEHGANYKIKDNRGKTPYEVGKMTLEEFEFHFKDKITLGAHAQALTDSEKKKCLIM